jgi:SAM-dependent methyltransferase
MKDKNKQIEVIKKILLETTRTKKHLAYQILSRRLTNLIDMEGIELRPKFEEERLDYILQKIHIRGKSILDIGCNTGYFLFELIDRGARFVTGYEGGKYHSEFCKEAISLLDINNANIINEYYNFQESKDYFDIVLLLNVLHHVGDDYGDIGLSKENAKNTIIDQLISLSKNAGIVVFQLGFNWKGDITKCLFENGIKREMIDYIINGIQNYYNVISIGVAQKKNGIIFYEDLNENNIKRDDSLGEFLNRPLFILKSKEKN